VSLHPLQPGWSGFTLAGGSFGGLTNGGFAKSSAHTPGHAGCFAPAKDLAASHVHH